MEVNVKLKFSSTREVLKMIDLLSNFECPMKDAKCEFCYYHESCLNLGEIENELESAILYEE